MTPQHSHTAIDILFSGIKYRDTGPVMVDPSEREREREREKYRDTGPVMVDPSERERERAREKYRDTGPVMVDPPRRWRELLTRRAPLCHEGRGHFAKHVALIALARVSRV